MVTGRKLELSEVCKGLLIFLENSIGELYSNRLDLIRTQYLNLLWKLNEWDEYTDSTGKFEGRIIDVADSGELLVMRRNGEIRQYGFKEIQYD